MPTTGSLSLYFHIPFCQEKCPYCRFFSLYPHLSLIEQYKKALIKELALYQDFVQKSKIATIYFGGGTPSLLTADFYEKILCLANAEENSEITIELSPNHVTQSYMQALKQTKINRLSLGIQSFDDSILSFLNRPHTAKTNFHAIGLAAEYFENISIDLMYEVPKQTLPSWENSLHALNELPVQHLSLYNLTFEKNTPFYKKRTSFEKQVLQPKELFLKKAMQILHKLKFEHYEISAFARNKKISQHNMRYWTKENFLGLGPSAFSFLNGKRFENVANLKKYFSMLENNQAPIGFSEKLPAAQSIKELFLINLRVLKGAPIPQNLPQAFLQKLSFFQEKGLLSIAKNKARLTKKGLFLYDAIASELY